MQRPLDWKGPNGNLNTEPINRTNLAQVAETNRSPTLGNTAPTEADAVIIATK